MEPPDIVDLRIESLTSILGNGFVDDLSTS